MTTERLTVTSDFIEKIAKEHGQAISTIHWCCQQLREGRLCNIHGCYIREHIQHICPYGIWKIPPENA